MLVASLKQAWPPFVLVAGLLAIGLVAYRDGLFGAAGAFLERLPGPSVVLFGGACVLVAAVTAVLNLDTAVVFVTPVIVLAARRRGLNDEPFLYAALFMANASSLYLPGSNLTNLLVLGGRNGIRGGFAAGFIAPALVATVVTLAGLMIIFGGRLGAAGEHGVAGSPGTVTGPGLAGATAAAVLTVVFRNPALPVLGDAVIVSCVALLLRRVSARELFDAVSPFVLAGVFAVAVGLGVLARAWDGPAQLLSGADRPLTAVIAAGATVLVNNLPAAAMLSAAHLAHPRALLIGLNLGPNLAVTGSLAAYLWLRSARQLGARTSWTAVTRRGLILAPVGIAAALLVSSH